MEGSSPIRHVVVLMLENRSFDHLLGHLDHGSLDPITPDTWNVKDVSDPDGERCHVHFWPTDKDVQVDPGHGFDDVVRQLTRDDPRREGPPLDHDAIDMGGFAWNYAWRLVDKAKDPAAACEIMGCHKPERVPVLSALAREFAVCTRWFCSVPSETWPNRLFAHGGQSEGLVRNVVRRYVHRCVFDVLADARITWAVYAGDAPQAAAYVELNDAFRDRFNTFGEFLDDVREGTLPAYSFVEPRYFIRVNSQHPTRSVVPGDHLLRRVYEALAGNPGIWASTLLVITHDEHGGFFDREKPPKAVRPNDLVDEEFGFEFDVLGVRVPAVVVSPCIAEGTVDDMVYDHTTIVRTVFDVLGVEEFLTKRDEQAASLVPLLTDARRAPPPLPPAPETAEVYETLESPSVVVLNDLQATLIELGRVLDEERGAFDMAEEANLAGIEEGAEVNVVQLEQVVERFRERHLGDRRARLVQDAGWS